MQTKRKIQKVIEQISKVLEENYRPERIILFGSSVTGKLRPDSDIDLLIVKETRQPFFQRLTQVRRLVSDARRGYPFEPIVLTPTELRQRLSRGDQFFAQIVEKGRVLYAHR